MGYVAAGSGSKVANVLRVTSSTFLEAFDFFLFGFYAIYISKAFFPSNNEITSLLLTFATFGVGFLMRPLGAVFLGSYMDKAGRRKGLIAQLGLMAAGTILIGLSPSYARIGLLAPMLAMIGRLLQGFGQGAEGVTVYLSEIATPGNRGFYVAWQACTQQVAVMAASLLGYLLNQELDPASLANWGWRIPFIIGCVIVPFLFYMRRSLEETGDFLARRTTPSLGQALRTIGRNFGIVLLGSMMVAMTTISFFALTIYTPTFGKAVLHLSAADSLLVTFCVAVSTFVLLPIMGALSDRVGRRPVLLTFSALMLLTAYPVLAWLIGHVTFTNMLMVELWLSFVYSGYNGALLVALTEIVPPEVRTAGVSLAFSLATATFGGFTPLIATWLIEQTGNRAAPGIWVSVGAICGLIGSFIVYGERTTRLASAAGLNQ